MGFDEIEAGLDLFEPSGKITAYDEGVAVESRRKINFIGDGVSAADNPATEAIDVTITGAAVSVDDPAVNGSTNPVASNWAFDHDAATTGVHGVGAGTIAKTADIVVAVAAAGLIMADAKGIEFTTPSANGTASGIFKTLEGHEDIAVGQVCYINTDGEAALALADDAAITIPALFICVVAVDQSVDPTGLFLERGYIHLDAWAFDIGKSVYLSAATAGLVTKTMPTKVTGNQVQVLGTCTLEDTIFWNPSMIVMEYA